MKLRVFDSPFMHRHGRWEGDLRWTACGIRTVPAPWPKDIPRPALPDCPACDG